LVAAGTAGSPVTFTSVRDDTIGGDTNGDGSVSSPAAGDWGGITITNGGAVTLDHARVAYGDNGVRGEDSPDGFTIRDSAIQNSLLDAIYLMSASPTAPAPVLLRNTVTNSGLSAMNLRSDTLDASKLDGNNGSGNHGGMEIGGSIKTSGTFTSGTLVPAVGSSNGYNLVIASGATLTIPAGQVWKAGNRTLYVDGSLVAAGTAGSPVTFTSVRDDTIGGDTNGDGSVSSPAAGDWGGIQVSATGTANLQGTTLRYASTALSVADGAQAEVHGKILNSSVGVSSNDYVDATNVDWGSPSGPAPAGTGTPISGDGVDVLPWVGYVAPPPPAPVPDGTSPSNQDPNDVAAGCKRVMFLAVRGSGEAPTNSDSDADYNNWLSGFGSRVWTMYQGFQGYMTSHGYSNSNNADWKGIGLRYRAQGVPSGLSLVNVWTDGSYVASYWEGVDRIQQYLADEYAKCGTSEKFVLAGYSQGALAIHIYLTQRAPSYIMNQIAAVGLQADPAKNKAGAESIYTDFWTNAKLAGDTGIINATGIYSKTQGIGSGSLPSSVTGRTVTLCNDHDIVCAPGWGSSGSVHGNYPSDELTDMGAWLADTAIASGLPAR
jgi:hypothetical protein